METYYILEDNLERLEKKLARIQNKCNAYDYKFHYKKGRPVFRDLTLDDGSTVSAKYIPVEVFGEVKHQDWRFVGTIDHHEAGNVIRQMDTTLEVPEYYRTTKCICEHCNTRRNRKETHLVYNDVTQEFKQVGKSCLTEYTRGLSAELVTSYIAMFDTLIQGEAPYTGIRPVPYYPIEVILAYAYQCVKHFSYWKTDSDRPTRGRCMDYFRFLEQGWAPGALAAQQFKEELAAVPSFNPQSEETKQFVEGALEYARNSTDSSSYMHNMRTICSEDFVKPADLGILVSLVPTYMRHLESEIARQEKEQAIADEGKASQFIGEVGARIEFTPVSVECVYSTDTMYGYSWLYKFVDTEGNVYMWWSSSGVDQDKEIKSVKGTVKSHEEYKGVKQTFLTRCRVAYN